MNPQTQEDHVNLGMAISPQHVEINETDFDFSSTVQEIVNALELTDEEKVTKILGLDNRVMNSYLAYVGLNINSFIEVVRSLVNEKNFTKALEIIDSLSQISSLDFFNPIVLDKYIATLEFIGMKTFRFGLNWSKLFFFDEVTQTYMISSKGLDKYCYIITKLKDKGIEPVITFSHFDVLGMDVTSPEFENFFTYSIEFILPRIISAGARKIIPFNESSVFAGAMISGHWGYTETKLKLNPLESAVNFYSQFNGYKRNLQALLKLNNIFYETAHQLNPDVEIILNMNVTQILFGTNESILRDYIVKPIGRGIENIHLNQFLSREDGQAHSALFDKISIHPYHIVNGAAFTTISGLAQLCKDIIFERKLPDYKRATKLSGRFIDPRIKDENRVKRGANGQILSPEINIELIIELCKRYGIKEIIITETGLDAKAEPQGIELKKWYYKNFIEQIPKLAEAGIRVSSSLFWSPLGNYEINGQHGGGMESFNFGALGMPLNVKQTKELLCTIFNESELGVIDSLIKKIFLNGNVPIQFYPEMLHFFHNLSNPKEDFNQRIENFISKYLNFGDEEEDLITSILQCILLFDVIKNDANIPTEIFDLLTRYFTFQLKRLSDLNLTYIDIDKLMTVFSEKLVEVNEKPISNTEYLKSLLVKSNVVGNERMIIIVNYLIENQYSTDLEPHFVNFFENNKPSANLLAFEAIFNKVLSEDKLGAFKVFTIIDALLKLTLIMENYLQDSKELLILRSYFLKFKVKYDKIIKDLPHNGIINILPFELVNTLESYVDNLLSVVGSPLKEQTIEVAAAPDEG